MASDAGPPARGDTAGHRATPELSERLVWTLDWQTRKLMPLLEQPGAEDRLRAYWTSARRMDEVLAEVTLGPGTVSVDIGGGLTTPLRWLPGEVICVDPLADHYAARFPPPTGRVTYTAGLGEALPVATASVDLAICTNCIDHTDDPEAVIREVARVLKPGGCLWFSCEIRRPERARNAGHPHALDRDALVALVSPFRTVLAWQEPWQGIYRYLVNEALSDAVELGFLLRRRGEGDVDVS